ncbi:Spo0E family sporulation regulatory protein-aspartic acid phosphatase [Paenibacillus alvei]|uniref:Spo0E family sporulation regulatory protein-aspartic acid phosphatase n=1 Tax=Paenibacillus alvei TaxID=44250 RepID=A0ABT4H2M1_PAEAL|nr:Spo0E family sporulation regulatory protein-aspartic acid phosphatase [Paenibacillus alvei]EJW13831.1 hypothetical protein PAV_109p00610 [Paenibacillus alvei DSM 29]MCY9540554.1 Spo0E family sporulation regulatory protein-aspartic acid phosphatase [Paenibacillus alvei]MCY9708241.1 Spo0E family sporulation regulatory protein-aspartic acid phosphatase [Paenibacillus alvei]MCY9732962.1 Spo0E family sporulation regulatory protein-aspartic acid phosphatase [Paenibacillus alvei]MCY9755161.1 Spo0E
MKRQTTRHDILDEEQVLKRELEEQRRKMEDTANGIPLCHPSVVKESEALDQKILSLMHLKKKKGQPSRE